MDIGLDEKTLRRIIALLVSFAGLAERAAGRAFVTKCGDSLLNSA